MKTYFKTNSPRLLKSIIIFSILASVFASCIIVPRHRHRRARVVVVEKRH